jgi:hypothetical protein
MRSLALIFALLSLGGSLTGKQMKVMKTRGVLMEKPQYWGRALADVPRHQTVKILDDSRFPWLRVQYQTKQGYLHASTFASETVKLAFAAVAEADDLQPMDPKSASLAARGFDQGIEDDYKRRKPDLAAAFGKLDGYEAVDAVEPDVDEMRGFLEAGALTGGGRAVLAPQPDEGLAPTSVAAVSTGGAR